MDMLTLVLPSAKPSSPLAHRYFPDVPSMSISSHTTERELWRITRIRGRLWVVRTALA